MALTAGTVINNARDLHPSLSKVNAPDVLGLRALSRFLDDLIGEVARRVPAFLGLQVTVPFPVLPFANGIDLTALIPGGWKDLLDAFFVYASSVTVPATNARGNFVPYEQRDMNSPLPAYTLRGNVLYLLGTDVDYGPFASLVLTYTPLTVDVTALASLIPLPDDSRQALSAMLAAFYLKRLVDDPQYRVTAATAGLYAADAREERQRFLTRIWRTTQRQDFVIRDVMSGR